MSSMKVLGSLLAVVAAGFSNIAAVEAQKAGDPVRGRELFETCLGCHGVEGYNNTYPAYKVPKLGGQSAGYIASALRAYRSGERKHATMKANAWNLSDQDAQDIGAYLEGLGGD